MIETYDLAIVGGGIMGCSTALRLAEDGMKTIVLDQGDLGQGASGVNAGTLSLQIKRVQLMPYALRGHSEWEAMGEAGLIADPLAAAGGLKLFALAGYVQAEDGRLTNAPGRLTGVIGAAPIF